MKDLYERHMLAVRQEIHQHPTARALLDSAIEPDVMERFLIEWTSRGVQVTYLRFVEDARALIERWNQRYRPTLDADVLLARPPTAGMRGYIDLHERTIAGSTPFARVAIEYELAAMSVSLLPLLLENFERVLGQEVMHLLSFLDEQVELGPGHAAHRRHMMETLLQAHPLAAEELAVTAAAALRSYLQFVSECLDVARAQRPHASIDAQNIPRLTA